MEFKDAKPVSLNELSPGDVVIVDQHFNCLRNNEMAVVQRLRNGELFIRCDDGNHYLEGQCPFDNQDAPLAGVRRVSKMETK